MTPKIRMMLFSGCTKKKEKGIKKPTAAFSLLDPPSRWPHASAATTHTWIAAASVNPFSRPLAAGAWATDVPSLTVRIACVPIIVGTDREQRVWPEWISTINCTQKSVAPNLHYPTTSSRYTGKGAPCALSCDRQLLFPCLPWN